MKNVVAWVTSLLMLSGCASMPPSPQALISVNRVMNSVTCGLAQAAAGQEGASLVGQRVSITLALQVVTDSSAGVGINASPSSGSSSSKGGKGGGGGSQKVVAAGSSLFPSITASYGQTWTSIHKTGYEIGRMPTLDTWKAGSGKALLDQCALFLPGGAEYVDNFAFHKWLRDTLWSLGRSLRIGDGKPWASIDTKFAVSTSGGISAQVPILTIIPLGATANLSKNDVQQLTVSVGQIPRAGGGGGAGEREAAVPPGARVVPPANLVAPNRLRLLPVDE